MHDVVIRGGTIVDGSGAAAFSGDVAVDGGTIVSVGGKAGPGKREISADGALVTPGWVDVHTHYDGQATWDPLLSTSSEHGVTTVLFGNCGVGFAPVRPEHRTALIDLLEGVEDIPSIVLSEGLKWDWESFPQYLDVLDGMPRAIDIAAQVPHHPLRVYVMGDRAIKRETATQGDIAEMRRLTEEALRAGAFGFTTSRTDNHKTPQGDLVPGRNAEIRELMGIGAALRDSGRGAFGMNSDFDDEETELEWVTALAKETGRPVWFLLNDRHKDPNRWRRLLAGVHRARDVGAPVRAQIPGRPIGLVMGVGTSFNPFHTREAYDRFEKLPLAERIERLRDPAVRAAVLADQPDQEKISRLTPTRQRTMTRWDIMFPLGTPPDYEPAPETSIAAIAQREGRTPEEVAYDYLTADVANYLYLPVTSFAGGNCDTIYSWLNDDACLLGLSDGGAHVAAILDAGLPTWMLTHWTRDRSRGPRIPLEAVVKRQTHDTAAFFGFKDRGLLKPGLKADVNVIDYDGLQVRAPEMAYDLPAGGRRLIQKVNGYKATIVSGQPVLEDGAFTGTLPGRLVRAQA